MIAIGDPGYSACATTFISTWASFIKSPVIAYEDSISLGNVKKLNLSQILKNGDKFLYNLRNKNETKHQTCKKCFGEPTRRGAIVRNIYNRLPSKIKNSSFVNIFKD